MNRITLVIPAKNEEKSLPYLRDEMRFIKCKKLLIVTKINKKILKLKKIYKFDLILQEKDGYGSAIIEGIKKVKTKYLCIYNADGSFDPKTLNKMYNIIKIDEKKFVFASRYEEKGGSLDDTFLTYIGNKIFTFIGNFFFKLKLSDILFTYVMGVTKNFNKLNLQSRDFRLCVEIPIKIKENSLLINTTASYERRRIAGVKNVNEFRDGFLILLYLLKKFLKNE
jgi:glycosyltransferase involved in cell wall biosynthesis